MKQLTELPYKSILPGLLFIPVISLAALVILVFLFNDTPFKSLYFFFTGPFTNVYTFGNMLNTAVPYVLGALGITIAVKAGCLNLGGEGQVYLGAFTAAAAALAFSGLGAIGGVLAVMAGIISGGALAAFSGFCRAKWNTNELITSFLLSCAVIPIVNFLVTGPFMDPQTSLLSTKKIPQNMHLFKLPGSLGLSAGALIAITFTWFVHFFLTRTKTGYELRMTGSNELFARYGGINTKLNTFFSMAISGGFYGLAGSLAVM